MAELIKLHNHLGHARYRMSLTEQKMFIYAIRHIDQESPTFTEVAFRLSDFAEDAQLSRDTLYRDIKNLAKNITATVIEIPGDDGDWTLYNLTSRCSYKAKEGIVKFKFNDEMKPLLLQLQKHYYEQSPEVIEFRSWHAIRLYDLIKSEIYKNIPIKVSLDKLKNILGIANGYPRFNTFRERVINPAVTEINERTNINLTWEKDVFGKKVLGIVFKAEIDTGNDGIVTIDEVESTKGNWSIDGKFPPDEAAELRRVAQEKTPLGMDPEEYIHRQYVYMSGQDVKRPLEYLKKALENDYANAANQLNMFDLPQQTGKTKNVPKNRFHNFEGQLSRLSDEELNERIRNRKRREWGNEDDESI